jgi:predicted DNA-binding helix-hairpin-helix protein
VAEDAVEALAAAAEFDICTSCDARVTEGRPLQGAITRLQRPDGGCLSVLKVLLSDACHYDCAYCACRSERRFRRHSLTPDALARAFIELNRAGLVDGLFLSSGIHSSPAESMEKIVTAVEILRTQHQFTGYVHLKVLPGAPRDCVERAVEIADRTSVNMEAPTQRGLDALSSRKHQAEDVIQRMHWIREAAARARPGSLKAGQTTQFVVGATNESDREIITAVDGLRQSVGLRRAYFSAFRPIRDTPLEGEPPCPPLRQHRLYQADWLLREYGFEKPDLAFDGTGNLPLAMDPKLAYALRNLHRFPIEVNTAGKDELLRVPGIGPRVAQRVLLARQRGRLTSYGELRALGLANARARPFLLVDGRREGKISDALRRNRLHPGQLELFLPAEAVRLATAVH